MKAHIVIAHPDQNSFNHEILQRVTSSLEKQNISYRVRDLYTMGFQPVFTAEDMAGVENNRVSSDIEEEQQQITDADLLVMVYPIWWWSQPAILKGYIDRVFTDGFAFEYKADGPVGLLQGKHAVVFTTTRESAEEMRAKGFDELIKKQIVDGTLSFVGFENVVHVNFAEVPYVSDERRKEMLNQVEQTMMSLRLPAGV